MVQLDIPQSVLLHATNNVWTVLQDFPLEIGLAEPLVGTGVFDEWMNVIYI